MKKLAYLFVVVCLALLIVALINPANAKKTGGGSVEQQVKALTEQVVQAGAKGDTSVLEKYYADDILIIHGDGKVTTKAQEVGDFKSGANKYEITIGEEYMRTYGNTVVTSLLLNVKGDIHGKPINTNLRSIRVWVKQKGEWKIVVYQVTRIAPASQ
jgi:ketosteroid isomerase-like protein